MCPSKIVCHIFECRKDSFVTHRAFCDALAEESARILSASNVPILLPPAPTTPPPPSPNPNPTNNSPQPYPFSLLSPPNFSTHQEDQHHFHNPPIHISLNPWDPPPLNPNHNPNPSSNNNVKPHEPINISPFLFYQEQPPPPPPPLPPAPAPSSYKNFMTSPFQSLHVSTSPAASSAHLSATALLQKAATVGAQSAAQVQSAMSGMDMGGMGGLGHVTAGMSPEYLGNFGTWQQRSDRGLTRDFLGLTGGGGERGNGNNNVDVNVNVNVNVRNLLSFTGGVEFPTYDRDRSLLRTRVGFGSEPSGSETWGNC